jgi:hypothetical protein
MFVNNTVRCTKSVDAHAGRPGFKFQVVLSLKRAPQQETLCVCYSNRVEDTVDETITGRTHALRGERQQGPVIATANETT